MASDYDEKKMRAAYDKFLDETGGKLMQRDWYFMFPDGGPAQLIPPIDIFTQDFQKAVSLNRQGYDIFMTVNSFDGARRIEKNLKEINSVHVECDSLNKEKQLELIRSAPLLPSLVVESKRSFHLYWDVTGCDVGLAKGIMKQHLVPFFHGDKNATDVTRFLRCPGFYHQKEGPADFLVKVVFSNKALYSPRDIMFCFPSVDEQRRKGKTYEDARADHWHARLYAEDQMKLLEKLSGSGWVNGEEYTFKPNQSGTWNIYVDGKGTSCWIDNNLRIGSHDNGGPTIFEWLKWYGHTGHHAVEIIKKITTGIFDEDKNQEV